MGGFIGENTDSSNGIKQKVTVDLKYIGIFFWNHRFVIGVLSFYQATGQCGVAKSEFRIGFVKFNGDGFFTSL